MLNNRLIRSLTLNIFLFLSVVIFHHLGGGSFSINTVTIPLFILSIFYFNARPLSTFHGPGLAAILVIFQLLGHLIFQSNQTTSQFRMYLSHATAIILTYFVARYFEKISTSLELLLASAIPIIIFKKFNSRCEQVTLLIIFQKYPISFLLNLIQRGRAPPKLRCA